MSKSHRSLCVSFSRTGAGLCIYHLFVSSNLNFLPTQSCLLLLFYFLWVYSDQLVVFHWSQGESKSPYISRTFLSTLANLNNAVVWMVSIFRPISNSSRPSSKLLLNDDDSEPITVVIILTLMFHSRFSSLTRSKFSLFLIFSSVVHQDGNFTIRQVFLLWLIITKSGLLTGIRWSVCVSKSQKF